MGCQCNERRAAIVKAVRRETTVLTAARFVAKTAAQDIASVTQEGTQRVMRHLQRRSAQR